AEASPRVAAVVVVGDVVKRPQPRIGGHRQEHCPSALADPAKLSERAAVVGGVLEHVEAGDEVECLGLPRQLLQAAAPNLAPPTGGSDRRGVCIEFDSGNLAVVFELLE